MDSAAGSEHLEMVKYLHQNDMPLTLNTMKRAVQFNKFENVKYLCDHDCPMDADILVQAATVGTIDMVHYLCEKGCPIDDNFMPAFMRKLQYDQYDINELKRVLKYNPPIGHDAIEEAKRIEDEEFHLILERHHHYR